MVSKTTIGGLALTAAALLAALRIIESSDGLEKSGTRLSPPAVTSATTISLSAAGREIAQMHRRPGEWIFKEPLSGRADPETVDKILTSVAKAEVEDRITPQQREDRNLTKKDFGLETPRLSVSFSIPGMDDFEIGFGNDSPSGGVFAQCTGTEDILVVSHQVFEDIPGGVDWLRDRTLVFSGVDPPVAIEIRRKAEIPAKIELDASGKWIVGAPFRTAADQDAAQRLLALISSRARHRFMPGASMADPGAAATRLAHGLAPEEASISIAVWRRRSVSPEVVTFGDEDPTDPGFVFAYSSPEGSFFTVEKTLPEAIAIPLSQLRERRVLPFAPAEIESFSFAVPGRKRTELRRNGSGDWIFTSPSNGDTIPGKVDEYLETIFSWRDKSAELPSSREIGNVGENDNLAKTISLSLKRFDSATPVDYSICRVSLAEKAPFWTLSGNDASAPIRILDDDTDPVSAFADGTLAALRDKTILALPQESISAVLQLDAEGQPFADAGGEAAAVAALATNFVAVSVSALSAADNAALGFLPPRVQWSLATTSSERPVVIIQLGAALPDGSAFVRIKGDGTIFVASQSDAATLAAGIERQNNERKQQ